MGPMGPRFGNGFLGFSASTVLDPSVSFPGVVNEVSVDIDSSPVIVTFGSCLAALAGETFLSAGGDPFFLLFLPIASSLIEEEEEEEDVDGEEESESALDSEEDEESESEERTRSL